nr:C13 family peptidase [uncultured Desulfobacter sp.]
MLKRIGKAAALAAALVFALGINGYSAELSLNQAKTKMVATLYKGEVGKRALYADSKLKLKGAKIASWRTPDQVKVSEESWFFFVDEQPGANWEHDAKYVLVNKKTGAIETMPVKTPPRDMLKYTPLNPVAKANLDVLKSNIKLIKDIRRPIKPIKIIKQQRYAVLLSGGWDANNNHSRYWNDLSFIYKTLKNKYGYNDDEIFVLYANGTHTPNEDLDGDGTDDVDYSATKANLTTVMNTIRDNIPAKGKFFFYSTNHGGSNGGYDAVLYLWQDWITDTEFADLTKEIKCAEAIYTMEQCYSGGMIDNILQVADHPCTNPKITVMSAATHAEYSWACDSEGDYDEYAYHWTSAVNGKTPSGSVINADTNGDGKVTMKEAHTYAVSQDSRNEHPVLGSCITGASDATLYAKITVIKPNLSKPGLAKPIKPTLNK